MSKTCTVEGCDKVLVASGLCNMHRMRLRQNGSVGESSPRWNLPADGMKFCKMCEKTLPIELFKGKRTRTYCSDCYPEYIKYRNIKVKYGLLREEYDTLVKSGCEICGSMNRLAIDHDHSCCPGDISCGRCIRGALCMSHNIILGHTKDDIAELYKLIKYLERPVD